MSYSDTSPECSYDSEDSETCFIRDYDIEVEDGFESANDSDSNESLEEMANADEPLADEEWLKRYNEEVKQNEELERMLQKRLDGTEHVDSWCSCGNCNRVLLQNLSECYCCNELDGCKEAMSSDVVLQDLPEGTTIKCITDHPGFKPVCLEKWSLRMAADKFRTKTKQRYQQTGTEESYLRSVAYREFSRLVYGFLGNKRIPLPGCAYTAIRKKFQGGTDESFTGFDLDEDE